MPPAPPEELALKWLPGDGPVELLPPTSGLVNHTYRVSRAGRHFSLRVPAPDSPDLGLERQWECRVLEAAGAAGLAPPVLVCDPMAGVLVTAWVEGRTWTDADARLEANVRIMAELLRRVHALPIPQPLRVASPQAWILRYGAAATRAGVTLPPRVAGLEAAAAARLRLLATAPPAAPVLCHSDLHRLNLVVAGQATLLDWEYAHVSEALWDLAGWATNNDWQAADAGRLLAAYLGRAPHAEESRRLDALMWLYDYVCVLWGALYSGRRTAGGDEVAARGARLVDRLSASGG